MPDTLFVAQGNDQGRRFLLTEASTTVGRDPNNAVRLHDFEVSRRHAEICREGAGFVLRDLASRNGVFVNGRRVQTRKLVKGDQIVVGRTTLLFGTQAVDSGARDPLVDVLQDADGSSSSRVLHSLAPEDGLEDSERSENAALSSWLKRARASLDFMCHATMATSRTLDVKRLLERILELIFQWAPVDRGCIFLYEPETNKLTPKASRARGKNARVRVSQTILNYAFENQKGVLTSNALDDRRWDGAASVVQTGVKEAICVPMQGRYGLVGAIYIDVSRSFADAGNVVESAPDPRAGEILRAGEASGAELNVGADDQSVSSGEFPASQDSSSDSKTPKLTLDHLKLMVVIGRQAALAIEDTQYFLGMAQAERLAAVGQAVTVLAHHIKNILQGVGGGSYLVETGLKEHDETLVRKGWNIVEKNQKKISDLVLDMLTFGKDREPNWTRSSFGEVVNDVVELTNGRAADLGVELSCRVARDAPPFYFDKEQIHRAILNLIVNALEASGGSGDAANDESATGERDLERGERAPRVDVLLDLSEDGKKVRVVVDDSGQGVPSDQRESIFRPFVSKYKSGGTGLGLAVTHKIVREHNGGLSVEDSPLGGARFVMEIPIIDVRPCETERE